MILELPDFGAILPWCCGGELEAIPACFDFLQWMVAELLAIRGVVVEAKLKLRKLTLIEIRSALDYLANGSQVSCDDSLEIKVKAVEQRL